MGIDHRLRLWLLLSGLVAVAACFFDKSVCHLMGAMSPSESLVFYRNLTDIGKAELYFKLSLIAWIVFGLSSEITNCKDLRRQLLEQSHEAWFALITLINSGLITVALKFIVGRTRPHVSQSCSHHEFQMFSFDHLFQSFPSGHTQAVFTFAFLLSRRFPPMRYPAIIFAMLIAGTRVSRNVHFVSDVIGGILVASVGLVLTEWIFNEYKFASPVRFDRISAHWAGLFG